MSGQGSMWRWFRRDFHLQIQSDFSEYLDGRLDVKARARLEAHFRGCLPCREELEALKGTVGLLQAMPQVAAPRSFRITEERTVETTWEPVWYGWLPRLRLASGAMALLFLLVVTIDLVNRPAMTPAPAGIAVLSPAQEARPADAPALQREAAKGAGVEEARPSGALGTAQAVPVPREPGDGGRDRARPPSPAPTSVSPPTPAGAQEPPRPLLILELLLLVATGLTTATLVALTLLKLKRTGSRPEKP